MSPAYLFLQTSYHAFSFQDDLKERQIFTCGWVCTSTCVCDVHLPCVFVRVPKTIHTSVYTGEGLCVRTFECDKRIKVFSNLSDVPTIGTGGARRAVIYIVVQVFVRFAISEQTRRPEPQTKRV